MAVSLQCAVDGDLVVVILGVSHLKNIQMVSAGKCGTCNYMEVSRTRLCENVSNLGKTMLRRNYTEGLFVVKRESVIDH